ncbi:uncharacterized protein si:dkeyp-122a9.2 [Danio rerio]|uniref:Uncharacterized protein si:dkeyp-122a9.2 n=1 Tax=Danio rerio TaxID=7955 RepID=A0A8M1RP77_DANRE|nr:uncharacterized protein si:dkeyp-122a9.2 [Danio rerio]|eukprot:XP_003201067.1 uncharacterized protein si:dkeyp-122a9.2 [Danio rerio]
MSLPEQMTNNLEKMKSGFGTFPFTIALFGLEMLMDREFSCPCDPGLNVTLIVFLFVGPAFLALTVLVFIRRPCKRKSQSSAEVFSFCLIPPSLWIFLLLFEGEYLACGLAHWEGDYVLDEGRQIKWCKPSGLNDNKTIRTDLLELTEKVTFYSRLSALALLSLLCISFMTVLVWSDCKTRPLEQLKKWDEQTQQTSLSGTEAELQQPPV